MRAEQILAIASDISDELESSNIVKLVDELSAALVNLSNTPSPAAEAAVTKARSEIDAALALSVIQSYPPALYQRVVELRISGLFGDKLKRRINRALEINAITPSKAAVEIKKISESLHVLEKRTADVIGGLIYYEVEADDLAPGEFEVMVQIPGVAIDDELGRFAKEANKLNQMIGVFCEIATGSREPVKLRALGSSDPTLFLQSPWACALMLATAIERIAAFYNQMLGIIKTHRDMKAQQVPPAVVDAMKKHIDGSIKEGLATIAKDLEKEYMGTVEPTRKQELKTELRSALLEIARRVDQGYIFDVRSGNEPDATATDEPSEELPNRRAVKIVQELRPKIQHFKAEAEPILSLSTGEDEDSHPKP